MRQKLLSILALLCITASSAWAQYNVTKDATMSEGWTISPTNSVTTGTAVKATYNGSKHVKSVKFVKKLRTPSTVTLSTSSISFTADDFSQDITVTRDGDGAITATSSNEAVAKVTVSGNVVTVHRARGAEGSATITISVAASEAYTAPAAVTCSYTQTNLRTPGDVTASDKGRFLGQFGYLWKSKADAAYSNEPLHAVVAYVGSCTNYFDKCLCVALEDISASTLTNAAAHTTLGTWAGNHPVNVWGITFSTDNGVYDYINGGVSWHPRTSATVKGWRLPTVCDLRYLMNSYNGTSLTTPSEIYHGVSCGNFSDLRTAINTACGNTNFKNSAYGTGSRDSSNPSNVGTWQYSTASTFYWADESYTYYYRAVFAY